MVRRGSRRRWDIDLTRLCHCGVIGWNEQCRDVLISFQSDRLSESWVSLVTSARFLARLAGSRRHVRIEMFSPKSFPGLVGMSKSSGIVIELTESPDADMKIEVNDIIMSLPVSSRYRVPSAGHLLTETLRRSLWRQYGRSRWRLKGGLDPDRYYPSQGLKLCASSS